MLIGLFIVEKLCHKLNMNDMDKKPLNSRLIEIPPDIQFPWAFQKDKWNLIWEKYYLIAPGMVAPFHIYVGISTAL